MNLKLNQRGFVLVEFVIALPLLILLLYALGTLNVSTAKISREQVANYTLEEEAQEIIDRIVNDARAAYDVEIKDVSKGGYEFNMVIFKCHAYPASTTFKDILDTRIYTVDNANNKPFHIYFKRQINESHNNPITGENFFGNTVVTHLKFSVPSHKVLRIEFEMMDSVTEQKVRFNTAVFMPAYEDHDDEE